MVDHTVKDMGLASAGQLKIQWAEDHMPVVMGIRKRFENEKPLKGMRIAACLHVTKETAVLAKTLKAGGAEVILCGSNPLSTQDDVAAALIEDGISVHAVKGQSNEEYYIAMAKAIAFQPHITMDDGADLVSSLHKLKREETGPEIDIIRSIVGTRSDFIDNVLFGTEETTTGVIRLRAMEADGALKYPIIAVNDAKSKSLFDNPIGTGQSTLDGIMRATNILFAGKEVVVAGYGNVGSGIADRARGLGAIVTVVEADPHKAMKAAMLGFKVANLTKASKYGDLFITATGDIDVLRKEYMENMKDGAVLCNSGHFNVEINLGDLEELSVSKREVRPQVVEYTLKDGRRVFVLAEGRLINLSCAEGHPSEVMDLSFAIQSLSVDWLVKNKDSMMGKGQVVVVPPKIDDKVASLKLEELGLSVEILTPKQIKYLNDWKGGTT
ncbi:MAG: adenosylhomocysteinase [Candidatus Ranarchaeia archaeon]|jgi:adenosylhomocysteinase